MIRKLVAAFVTILFAASLHATAFADNGFIPVDGDTKRLLDGNFKAGDIIRVTGVGAAPLNWDQRDSFAKTFARQAARMDALRELTEHFQGVTFTSEVPLAELDLNARITTRISQDSKVFKLLEKNARVVEVKFSDDGVCEVTMEVVFPTDWKR